MAVDGDEVDDDDDRDMLLLSLLLCWNASLQRGPCDLPLVWVHVRVVEACGCNGLWPLVVESLWLQWPVAAGCGKPGCDHTSLRMIRLRPYASTEQSVHRRPCSQVLRDGLNVFDIFASCPYTALNGLRRIGRTYPHAPR